MFSAETVTQLFLCDTERAKKKASRVPGGFLLVYFSHVMGVMT